MDTDPYYLNIWRWTSFFEQNRICLGTFLGKLDQTIVRHNACRPLNQFFYHLNNIVP